MNEDSSDSADEKSPAKAGSLLTKIKIGGAVLVLILGTIVILQNTESVETKILFMDLKMPRAMLLLLSFLFGTGFGFLLAFLHPWRKSKP